MTYYGAKEMAESWRTVRKNTIQAAEEIPEDKYGYKAAPDTMTVGEMLAHLATSTLWAEQSHFIEKATNVTMEDFGRLIGESNKVSATLTTKAAIVEALKKHGDRYASHLEAMTDAQLGERVALPNGSKTRFEMLLGVKEHEMHHRAQIFLIQRVLGIIPHLTRARQERMRQPQK